MTEKQNSSVQQRTLKLKLPQSKRPVETLDT